MLVVLICYSSLGLLGSTDIQIGIWTIWLAEDVFKAGPRLVVNVTYGAYPISFTYSPRLYNIGGSLLFRVTSKSIFPLKYFDSHTLSPCLGKDLVLTAMSIHRSFKVDRERPRNGMGSPPTTSTLLKYTAWKEILCWLLGK